MDIFAAPSATPRADTRRNGRSACRRVAAGESGGRLFRRFRGRLPIGVRVKLSGFFTLCPHRLRANPATV
jgi:hypothetical protein